MKKKIDFFLPIEAKSWHNEIKKKDFYLIGREVLRIKPITHILGSPKLSIDLTFLFKEECSLDIDNMVKTVFDFLQREGVIKNDKQFRSLRARVVENTSENGISIKIEKLRATLL